MNVLLLAGGVSNERDVSLRSGKAVAAALQSAGHTITTADPADKDFDLIKLTKEIDVVFPALHGEGGEDGMLQEQLENLGIRFIGSGSTASKLCWHKWNYKRLLIANQLPASKGKIVTEILNWPDDEILHKESEMPFVLKPNRGGSSLDTLIARQATDKDRKAAQELLRRYPTGMLLEPIIEGVEITVGILDKEPLPVIEIIPPEGLEFDYENKYNGKTQDLCPPQHVGEDLQLAAQELALKIHELTGCSGMSRTDMIIDTSGELHVLETNTIPGMTEVSLLPVMVNRAGYSMEDFVQKLLDIALANNR